MLNKKFIHNGFTFIQSNFYLNQNNSPSIHDLKKIFDLELDQDMSHEFRKRAYLKLKWFRTTGQFELHENQSYFQTASANNADGGKVREFKVMHKKILNLTIIQNLIQKNLTLIERYEPLKNHNHLVIGMHFIRYIVRQNHASFSSPDWLHKDDEPLVFVHLVDLSPEALGGDNLIADSNKKITHVIRLEKEMDTLVLNKSVYHAVTPLGSRTGVSTRDVILFTIEPAYTQISAIEGKVA